LFKTIKYRKYNVADLDDDLPRHAHELRAARKLHRERKAAEDKALARKTSFSEADIEAYDRYQLGQVSRELRGRDRLISKMEALMHRDYDTFMERFSDHYARLTGATTN